MRAHIADTTSFHKSHASVESLLLFHNSYAASMLAPLHLGLAAMHIGINSSGIFGRVGPLMAGWMSHLFLGDIQALVVIRKHFEPKS